MKSEACDFTLGINVRSKDYLSSITIVTFIAKSIERLSQPIFLFIVMPEFMQQSCCDQKMIGRETSQNIITQKCRFWTEDVYIDTHCLQTREPKKLSHISEVSI